MPITKKHKSILFSGIALMAGATLLAGCSADPLPVSKSEQYTRDFIKTFGAFDQSHDWNHATQATVTVTTPAPTEVKIMADFEGKRYIFATYTNVEGTKTLNVDIPKGISDLIVAANGKNYSVKAGGEVDTSKAARSSRAESNDGFSAYVNEDYRCIPTEVVESYTRKLPEGVNNFTAEEVSYNYSFISDGKPFTFYPIFWYTASRHHLGIYWYDKGHYGEAEYYHEQEVYMSKTGLLQYYTEETWPGKFTLEEDVLIEGTGTEEKWCNESELYPKIKAENGTRANVRG
ncbi:hypothetical protein [Duncaniella muris]|uniref:hypothetical protein n=1 Tax=Duncaniella muris TaxID=2094150 RepID=UPI0026382771|nr:hypothetical protein [Duncaniella muris]